MAQRSDRPHALVIGGSVGGLFAGLLLQQQGWTVAIFERSGADLADRGTAIGTAPPLYAVLQRIGLPIDPTSGVPVHARICMDAGGRVLAQLLMPSVTSSWDSIYRPLRRAFPADAYHVGRNLARVEQAAGGVTAIFADGSRATGDVLVGADGIGSTVRQQMLPEVQARYAGYVAWRFVAEEGIPPDAHELLDGRMAFCLPEGELALAVTMPGPGGDVAGGRHRHYVIWFRPADPERALPDLCTDATGRCHGAAIPPALIRPELIAALKERARAVFPSQVAAIVERTTPPLLHAIFDLESPRLVFGRVVLLGDAAFVARPHVATGVTKAALDAACLADALGAEVGWDAALARYERERLAYGRAIVDRGRYLGAYLEAQSKQRDQGRVPERDPEVLLREYGAAGQTS